MLLRRIKIVEAKNLDNEIKMIAQHQKIATKEEIKKNFEQVKARILPELMKVWGVWRGHGIRIFR